MTTTEQTSINTPLNNISDETFYSIINRLKAQKALPSDSFPKEVPFFNFTSISKESQVKEIYQDLSNPVMYKSLFKNILSLPDEKSGDLITKRLSAMQVMGFAQMILYKVLPCTAENCPNKPREVATQNQYKDYEYECPFYHHEKDQRRMVLAVNIEDEFVYKANYFEENKMPASEKDRCSQNYFESLFHPLYYKMFRCKRTHCNFSQFCPFFHSEEEKKTWDRTFANFIRKDRVSYVKDKQKYLANNSGNKFARAGNENKPSGFRNNGCNQNKQNYKPKCQQPQEQKTGGWRSQIGLSNASKDFENQKKGGYYRTNSGESSDNSSPVSFGKYYNNKENININRVC